MPENFTPSRADSFLDEKLQPRFEKSLEYYRSRGGVVFVSYCRFWEKHGFVQQSLARFLTENQVPVTWLDGAGWRSYAPSFSWKSPFLTVRQIQRLPGERVAPVRSLSLAVQVQDIKRAVKAHGGGPVLWVQAGLEKGIAQRLPYIDVFSTFDDPYRHLASDPLCQRAQLVVCQNQFTYSLLGDLSESKRVRLLPPIDMRQNIFQKSVFDLPRAFPKQIMGYIGSFYSDGFDLFLMEYFVKNLGDWGFILMGRTNAVGLGVVERLRQYKNFLYIPWANRVSLASVWSKLNVNLLLYRHLFTQDGAFPVKLVEGLRFGIPAVGTSVNKTRDIADYFPRSSFADQLVGFAIEAAKMPGDTIQSIYDHFRYETDPRLQLSTAAETLSAGLKKLTA